MNRFFKRQKLWKPTQEGNENFDGSTCIKKLKSLKPTGEFYKTLKEQVRDFYRNSQNRKGGEFML
jgi:hypothetical protein